MGIYALINPINNTQIVINTIVAAPEIASTYLIANEGEYEYVIQIDEVSPSPGIGWSYDPVEEEFAAPPIDHEAVLFASLIALEATLDQAMTDYWAANETQRGVAVGNALSELSEIDEDELNVLISAITWMSEG